MKGSCGSGITSIIFSDLEFEDCVEIFKEMTERYEGFLNASTIEIQERANAALQTIKILEKLKATAVLKELFEGRT